MEEHAALLSMLTGPTSSLVLLLGMLVAAWRVATQSVLPAVQGWVDKHLTQVDAMLAQHQKDRDAWLRNMDECNKRADTMLGQLERIDRKVGGLYGRLPPQDAAS